MHFTIIVNKTAGSGRGLQVWKQVEPLLAQNHVDYDTQFTRYAGHATYLASQLAKHWSGQVKKQVVVVVGGDGTLHETLNGLMTLRDPYDQRIPLAYVPAGTGNDFARGFGLSLDPAVALQQILSAQHPQRTTIGEYDEAIKGELEYFLNNVGIGFDAAIVSRTNASKTKKRLNHAHIGSLSYLANAVNVLYNQQPFSLMVENGRHHDLYPKSYIVIVSNHPYIGGGFKIAPSMSVHDDQLELLVAERHGWPLTALQCLEFARGTLAHSRYAHVYNGKKLHYATSSLEFGQTDGQEMGNRFVDISFRIAHYPFWIASQKTN
ncbi:diacylglycerol/lipid kinase family protein [Limosilactobacillus difficilis]|uniref:diacylglycerol/lipid kinase family protein n=1 Tax=Limosilactobacillus difficilis TaxID=2991838 RepID=UPI0024B88F0D|nr:YegS/Rv2252/BmrU family lipid kinase [Limosilactobacillus difficilis]